MFIPASERIDIGYRIELRARIDHFPDHLHGFDNAWARPIEELIAVGQEETPGAHGLQAPELGTIR